jgi:C1A family cysteine protease
MLSLAILTAGAYAATPLRSTPEKDFQLFQEFVKEHKRVYDTAEEYVNRFKVFQDFLDLVDQRNQAESDNGNNDTVHGITMFADMSQAEFQDKMLMKPGYYKTPEKRVQALKTYDPTAANVDWRTQGVITPVKNQAQCGSCWAFSATEAVESYGIIQKTYSPLTQLSTEQTCSCTYSYNGCNGGNPQVAYTNAMQKQGGEEDNTEYPYTMNCAPPCGAKSTMKKFVTTSGYKNMPLGSLQSTLAGGPPSVCVAAESWNTYKGGVVTSCPGTVDHCVQAVGYTIASTQQSSYYIVRNSWGTSWGIQGYIYLSMAGDTCLVQSDINYPITAAVSG